MAHILLVCLLVLYAVLAVVDSSEYKSFVKLQKTEQRQRVLKKWVLQSFFVHGVLSLLCLALLGQLPSLLAIPDPMLRFSEQLSGLGDGSGGERWGSVWRGLRLAFLPALIVGSLASALLTTRSEHQARKKSPQGVRTGPGNIQPLLPRNRDERLWTALLSVNAGLTEEIAFRLLLPVLFWLVLGNAAVSLILSVVVFGLAHLYQGWPGVLATAVAGALLMFVYLLTGSLWAAIVVHVVFDLSTLAIAPWYADHLSGRSSPCPGRESNHQR